MQTATIGATFISEFGPFKFHYVLVKNVVICNKLGTSDNCCHEDLFSMFHALMLWGKLIMFSTSRDCIPNIRSQIFFFATNPCCCHLFSCMLIEEKWTTIRMLVGVAQELHQLPASAYGQNRQEPQGRRSILGAAARHYTQGQKQ